MDYAEGVKLTDPRRMAVYVTKYGAAGGKDYQHQAPSCCLAAGGSRHEYPDARHRIPPFRSTMTRPGEYGNGGAVLQPPSEPGRARRRYTAYRSSVAATHPKNT